MCVDKEHFTCCCCSLTTATYVFGCFTGLATVMYIVSGMWINFALSLFMTCIYIAICIKPSEPTWRKMLYYTSLIGWILTIVIFLVVCILGMVGGSAVE